MVSTRSKAPSAHAIAEDTATATPVCENAYKNQALNLLEMKFPRLSVAAIRCAFASNGSLFTPAYEILSRIDIIVGANKDEERTLILAEAPFLQHVRRLVLKGPRRIPRPRIVDPTLVEEVNAIPEMKTKENRSLEAPPPPVETPSTPTRPLLP
jgi:hypothetical protein